MSLRIKLNNKEVSAEEGDTILNVLEKNGIYVPHVCYNPRLGPIKTCDLCLVEANGKIVRSCETKVEHGMVVSTDNEKVKGVRRKAFDSVLKNHNMYCTFCDNNVDCELHEAVSKEGVYSQHFVPKPYVVDDSNPFYVYDPKQCILCGRCVEACQDVVVNEVIRINWDLNPPRVVWSNGKTVDYSSCVSCGTCVTVCPVNALMEKSILGEAGYFTGINKEVKEKLIDAAKAGEKNFSPFMLISDIDKRMRNSLIKKTKTVCTFCGTGCSFEVWTKGRKILKVEPKPESPANGIATCIKGKFGLNFVNSGERLTKPLIREGDHFREASWDEAIRLVASKLQEIKGKFGPDSVGIIASCTSTNEEGYLAQKFARAVIGTNNVDNCARYCQSPATTGLIRTVGYGADSGSSDDLACANLVILIGTNTAEAHPVIAGKIKRAHKLEGKKLVVIDVRKHEMAERADLFITPNVGTDVVLINGIAKAILDHGWEDKEFIEKRTTGFEEYRKSLEKYTIEYVEKVTGVKGNVVEEIARTIHESGTLAIAWAMGVTQHQDGSETSTAISNLLLLTGNYGKPCSGAFPLRGHANVQGVGDVGALPNYLPGYQPYSEEVIRKLEDAWGRKLPRNPGLTSTDMVDAILQGKIHAMYIMGEDKVLADSDQSKTREALSKLDFLVVQDMFFTETAKYAHVILPAAAFLEKDGTFTNTERRIQRLYKVMEPLGDSKPDWEIIQLVANQMDAGWNYVHPSQIMDEISATVPIYAGVTYGKLEGFKSILWPLEGDKDSRFLYREKFPFPDGKAKFYVTKEIPPLKTDQEYNLYLVNGRMLEHFHWMRMTGKTQGIMYKLPETFLEVSPQLAESYGLKDGDTVMVRSETGKLMTKVLVTNRVSGNKVFLSIHDDKDMNVNIVTLNEKDPAAKTPAYKETPVRIEKIESCTNCEPPLPKWNPRNAERTPQRGVMVEKKWERKDYVKVI
ncbi:formate dehydrogenase subunit alpha [Sulfuracidifex metallicus]|uniref:Formate dehydrogenase subunit alpha n=1 Tax=Sulfuracidifex metallicus DSM 6482 = JCM 9184 TaxID=523847 RepID=A0A6A9QNV4_SULME|nr:formate dehydrogenase subunit alpha [Sulfuracidifex metallicus]MUN29829.1 formate dehydrogenase subunit alpha [Sulfuracidifex metallicus DSM 6482 = JCM 9184]